MLYFGYLVAGWVASLLPRRFSRSLAALVAGIWYAASPALRHNLDQNLALVPALRQRADRRSRVARKAVRNFALTVTDLLYLPRMNTGNLNRFVAVEEFQRLKQMLAGRPALLVTAHIGSWEMAAAAAGLVGIDLHVIVWDHPDRRIAAMFRRLREAKGVRVMSVRAAARSMPSALETSCVGLAGDRDFTGQGMLVRFLGALTHVPSAYAALAASKGVPVIPVFCLRLDDGRYHLFHESPITAAGAAMPEEKIVGECLQAFQKYIEKYPEQWYRFQLLAE